MSEHTLCGYSNCFRPFFKMRGFMPCCSYHYENPLKWGKDGRMFTGSVFRKLIEEIKPEGVHDV